MLTSKDQLSLPRQQQAEVHVGCVCWRGVANRALNSEISSVGVVISTPQAAHRCGVGGDAKRSLGFVRYDWLELLLLPTLKFELMGARPAFYWCLFYPFQLLPTIILKPILQPHLRHFLDVMGGCARSGIDRKTFRSVTIFGNCGEPDLTLWRLLLFVVQFARLIIKHYRKCVSCMSISFVVLGY